MVLVQCILQKYQATLGSLNSYIQHFKDTVLPMASQSLTPTYDATYVVQIVSKSVYILHFTMQLQA